MLKAKVVMPGGVVVSTDEGVGPRFARVRRWRVVIGDGGSRVPPSTRMPFNILIATEWSSSRRPFVNKTS
jgi:hypothetical protein